MITAAPEWVGPATEAGSAHKKHIGQGDAMNGDRDRHRFPRSGIDEGQAGKNQQETERKASGVAQENSGRGRVPNRETEHRTAERPKASGYTTPTDHRHPTCSEHGRGDR